LAGQKAGNKIRPFKKKLKENTIYISNRDRDKREREKRDREKR
jgi:hypothetical protein